MTRAVPLAALALTASLAPLAAPAFADPWSRTFAVGSGAALEVHAGDAQVHVASWDEPSIRIDVEARGYRLRRWGLRPSATQLGDRVRFALTGPVFEVHLGLSRRTARVEIRVPRQASVDVSTGDGSVACEGVRGPVRLSTGDGNVTVSGLRGDVVLRSGDGEIDASDVEGALRATTGDGRIRVQGTLRALDVSSRDGGVTVSAAAGSRVETGWTVTTTDGPVLLRIPADLSATLDARTVDGRLAIDVPVRLDGPVRHDRIRARLNGGGPDLQVRTGDGPITVESLADASER